MRDERRELLYLVAGGIIGAVASYVFLKGGYKLKDLGEEVKNIISDYKKLNEKMANVLDRLEKTYEKG